MGSFKNKIIILVSLMILTGCSNDTIESSEEVSTQAKEEVTSQEQKKEEIELERDTSGSEEESSSGREAATSEAEVSQGREEEIGQETVQASITEDTTEYQWLYDELNGKEFMFSSGAGAWRTHFTFSNDGYFSGVYSDTDGRDIAISEFEGQFTIQEESDEFTYQLTLENLNVTSATGTEEPYLDGTLTYVAEPHGFQEGSRVFELYLPFKPLAELPQAYYSWVQYNLNEQYETLNQFGLFNTAHQFGMIEYFG